ncbi:hypothetical protein OSB04_021588 [Centaurea solstitialis]|uniref:Uncharacterized protein n=1 Tax=Centaurea solstitialis TaxID=347529 RepID=A0AA38SUG3_9ASTR|nr:hypothetical protein OSB04_021588 [Centaurea solstitialis]
MSTAAGWGNGLGEQTRWAQGFGRVGGTRLGGLYGLEVGRARAGGLATGFRGGAVAVYSPLAFRKSLFDNLKHTFAIKSNGDLFYIYGKQIDSKFLRRPQQLSRIVNSMEVKLELWALSSFGIISMPNSVAKTLVHEINEEKRSISFKVLEGELLELYKTFVMHGIRAKARLIPDNFGG